jgi:uncharacterized metal-binding protein
MAYSVDWSFLLGSDTRVYLGIFVSLFSIAIAFFIWKLQHLKMELLASECQNHQGKRDGGKNRLKKLTISIV